MTEQADPPNKALRILLEALTTISYLKRESGQASAIAEFALDCYGKAIREAGAEDRSAPESDVVPSVREWRSARSGWSGRYFEPGHGQSRRHGERRRVDCGPPAGCAERRVLGDRRAERRGR